MPSNANYNDQNVAWLIEFFAGVLGESHEDLRFRYDNNTDEPSDDILVAHPRDKLYLPEKQACQPRSAEILRYEEAAKKSDRLKAFEEASPANIEYFNDPCESGVDIPLVAQENPSESQQTLNLAP